MDCMQRGCQCICCSHALEVGLHAGVLCRQSLQLRTHMAAGISSLMACIVISSKPPPLPLQAAGLALPGSDLDVVVLGVAADLANPAEGYSWREREHLVKLLRQLLTRLQAAGMLAKAEVIMAKVGGQLRRRGRGWSGVELFVIMCCSVLHACSPSWMVPYHQHAASRTKHQHCTSTSVLEAGPW